MQTVPSETDVREQPVGVPDQPLAAPLPARDGTGRVDVDMLLAQPQFGSAFPFVAWLDDSRIAYSLPPVERGAAATIEVLDVDSAATVTLGEGANPQASPDGRWLACFRVDGPANRLWLLPTDGAQAVAVEGAPTPAGPAAFLPAPAWSPDSRQVVIVHPTNTYAPEALEATTVAREQPKGDDAPTSAVEAENVLNPSPPTAVAVVDVTTGVARTIATVDEPIRSVSWLPNGEEIVFERIRIGWLHNEIGDTAWVQAMRVDDGSIRTLATFAGMQQALMPVVAPRGDRVAVTADVDNPDFNYLPSVCLLSTIPPGNGSAPAVTRLTHEVKLLRLVWSPDGATLYAMRIFGAYMQVYAVDASTGSLTQLTDAPRRIEAFALSPDGTRLAWAGQDLHGTRTITVAAANGAAPRDVVTLAGAPADVALSEVREVDWAVADYPVRMRGALILPLDHRDGTRFPLLVDVHGGGPGASMHFSGAIVFGGALEWQHFAALGYGVLVPEFRSSAVFGHLAITRDYKRDHDVIDRDVADISAGVDALVDAGLVDPARTAFIGMSAGARRANWAAVATHRFAAIVSQDGWADEWFGAGIYRSPSFESSYGGPVVVVPENYQRNSALFHAQGADTPTLFLMGNPRLGGADHHNTVRWLYNALRAQGVPAQYVQYPDEGHGLKRPANLRDALQRTTSWLATHLGQGRSG